jgi:hypothetical protein
MGHGKGGTRHSCSRSLTSTRAPCTSATYWASGSSGKSNGGRLVERDGVLEMLRHRPNDVRSADLRTLSMVDRQLTIQIELGERQHQACLVQRQQELWSLATPGLNQDARATQGGRKRYLLHASPRFAIGEGDLGARPSGSPPAFKCPHVLWPRQVVSLIAANCGEQFCSDTPSECVLV